MRLHNLPDGVGVLQSAMPEECTEAEAETGPSRRGAERGQMSKKAHEHFCAQCYGKKTNGICSGWWRCVEKNCTRVTSAQCKKHRVEPREEPR